MDSLTARFENTHCRQEPSDLDLEWGLPAGPAYGSSVRDTRWAPGLAA